MSKNAIFMIEGGKPLEMIKQHIAERMRVRQEIRELAKELGVEEVHTDRGNGVLRAVVFTGDVHPEFTKPKKDGASYPKKGSIWAKRLAEQKGYRDPSEWISSEFGVPLTVSYKTQDGGWGSTCIGNFINECGFLYLSEEGPYAMWVPDVPAYVAQYSGDGTIVDEPAASFKMEFKGCRRIEDEEWEILVLQDKLAKKKSERAAAFSNAALDAAIGAAIGGQNEHA